MTLRLKLLLKSAFLPLFGSLEKQDHCVVIFVVGDKKKKTFLALTYGS